MMEHDEEAYESVLQMVVEDEDTDMDHGMTPATYDSDSPSQLSPKLFIREDTSDCVADFLVCCLDDDQDESINDGAIELHDEVSETQFGHEAQMKFTPEHTLTSETCMNGDEERERIEKGNRDGEELIGILTDQSPVDFAVAYDECYGVDYAKELKSDVDKSPSSTLNLNEPTTSRNGKLTSTEKLYYCKFCSFSSNIKSNLKCHMATHSNEKPFHCSLCPFRSGWASSLNAHVKAAHSSVKLLSCTFCPFTTKKKSNLQNHMSKHSYEKPHKCNFCEFKTGWASALKRHTRITHGPQVYYRCTKCTFTTVWVESLRYHMAIHREQVSKSKLCASSLSKYGDINIDLVKPDLKEEPGDSNTDLVKQDLDKKRGDVTIDLVKQGLNEKCGDMNIDHVKQDTIKKRDDVNIDLVKQDLNEKCGDMNIDHVKQDLSKKRDDVNIDLVKQDLNKKQGGADIDLVKQDLNEKLGDVNIDLAKQELNGKRVDANTDLVKQCLNAKPFRCTHCALSYSREINFNKHLATVHGEGGSYSCQMCSFSTGSTDKLIEHNTIAHIKPFECQMCQYRSSFASSLEKHVTRVHATRKLFKCTDCPYETSWSQALRRHRFNKHSSEQPEGSV